MTGAVCLGMGGVVWVGISRRRTQICRCKVQYVNECIIKYPNVAKLFGSFYRAMEEAGLKDPDNKI